MIFSWVICIAVGNLTYDLSLPHNQYPLTDSHDLGELAGDKDDRYPPGGQLADDAVDLAFGSHIDAPGGFVQDQNLWIDGQPARQKHLLLVSPRKFLHPHGR